MTNLLYLLLLALVSANLANYIIHLNSRPYGENHEPFIPFGLGWIFKLFKKDRL